MQKISDDPLAFSDAPTSRGKRAFVIVTAAALGATALIAVVSLLDEASGISRYLPIALIVAFVFGIILGFAKTTRIQFGPERIIVSEQSLFSIAGRAAAMPDRCIPNTAVSKIRL